MAYLYRHIRLDKNVPFYIGIGKDPYRATSKSNRSTRWKNIVAKTDYRVDILFDDIDYEYAKQKEIEFISLYKRKEDGGTLCNITIGGDGFCGAKHSADAREKMGAPNRGKVISEWHRKRISEFHKGRKRDDDTKKKLSNSKLGSKNHRFGKPDSEETRLRKIKSAKRGENNLFSKLNNLMVLDIRKASEWGLSSIKIAAIFGVAKSTVLGIVKRKTWTHI